jgi:hypothetical protein
LNMEEADERKDQKHSCQITHPELPLAPPAMVERTYRPISAVTHQQTRRETTGDRLGSINTLPTILRERPVLQILGENDAESASFHSPPLDYGRNGMPDCRK